MTKSGRPSEIGFYDFALIIMNKCCVGTCLNETQGEFVLQFWHQFKVPLDWCIIRHLIPWLSALVITDPTTPPGADRLGWSAMGECAWWAERLPAHCEDENKLRWCLRQEPEIRRAVSVKGSFWRISEWYLLHQQHRLFHRQSPHCWILHFDFHFLSRKRSDGIWYFRGQPKTKNIPTRQIQLEI